MVQVRKAIPVEVFEHEYQKGVLRRYVSDSI